MNNVRSIPEDYAEENGSKRGGKLEREKQHEVLKAYHGTTLNRFRGLRYPYHLQYHNNCLLIGLYLTTQMLTKIRAILPNYL